MHRVGVLDPELERSRAKPGVVVVAVVEKIKVDDTFH